ncbi:hypothetical protein L4174_009615 [Photobacterium sp. CCB-ST2H9]|uniref:LIC_13387 family protein n=1 Tax=Photobacterium sp. CCB-ST2H9 TaxID=2912855 RepID=UPI002004CF3D|nr:hypothetical protein [Photobacterium sp. CCB-ST2H9]UTM56106.1 hypothetical protein L4174_009615 [Photobacterium sp. CCB-ST2H9]
MDQLLLVVGLSILGLLGTIHLFYTFFTEKFTPFDASVTEAMKATSPRLTKETTVWRAWVGFNASHSLGVMFFAAVYISLATYHFEVVKSSLWLSVLPVIVGFAYLILAYKYWFKIPFIGVIMSLCCFMFSAWLINM